MNPTVYVESSTVEVRHYDNFSVVQLAEGVTIHFATDVAAEDFANRITTRNQSAMNMWLDDVDLRVDSVNPQRKDNR